MPTQKIQLVLLVMSCWLPSSEAAAVALPQYTMDLKSSCISAGLLDIPRGQSTVLQGPSKDALSGTQELNCILQFTPQTEGDTLKMTLDTSSRFEDCDITLELRMPNSNPDNIIRTCKSGPISVNMMSAVNGKAYVRLSRMNYDHRSYWFQVTVTAVRTEMAGTQDTASTGDVGLIVGITVGIIAFLVLIIIVCIVCYRRRNTKDLQKSKERNNVVENPLSANVGHGYENNMAKISYDDSFQQSPGSDRKLLSKNHLGNDVKSKSALERFGNTAAHKEKSDVANRQASATQQRDGQDNPDFVKKERNLGQDARRNISKQRVAEERLEKSSDHSSFTDTLSQDSSDKPVRTPKLIPIPKSPPKSSGLQRQRDNISDSNQSEHSVSSESARYKDEKNKVSSINTRKNLSSDKQDLGWDKSQRKHEEKKKQNIYEEYDSRDKIREKGLKPDKKLHNYRSQEDDDSEMMEETRNGRKAPKSEHDDRSDRRENVEHEGRFKKSASGRKPQSKGPRMARSKSAGNALEDLYSDDPKRQPKSPSVRSLSLLDDDDDYELDSNYMPFRRSGSKTSLYASRSSLYGRRRKNSMGETVSVSSYALSSYIHDDLDSRVGDFDHTMLSNKEKERLFKSTGDLNVSTAIIVRECATQTGGNKEVYSYGRKTVSKRRHRKCFNRGTQTTRQRRDSAASDRSGRSHKSGRSVRSHGQLRSKSRSKESLSRKHRSRSRDLSDDNTSERSGHRRHHERQYTDDSDSEDEQYRSRSKSNQRDNIASDRHGKRSQSKSKERMHSKPRHRDHSESEDEQSVYSSKSYETNNGSTGKKTRPSQSKSNILHNDSNSYQPEQNSNLGPYGQFAMTSGVPVHPFGQQIPQYLPTGYPMVIPQPTAAFMSTDQNGLPIMIPVTSLTERAIPPKPTVAVKPNASKWDELVNITEGMKKRRHQMGESLETESVLSSAWSQPHVYHSETPYMKTQEMHGSGRMYGEHYDADTPSEYTVGYSRKYSATDSSV